MFSKKIYKKLPPALFKLKKINRLKRKKRFIERTTHSWNQFNVAITFKRRNSFVNLGRTDYIALLPKRKQKKVATRYNRRYFTQTISYISAGNCGLRGSQKSAPMANITIGELAASRFKKYAQYHLRGRFFGSGRRKKEILKGFVTGGLILQELKQQMRRPYNGVRHKKRRRK